MFHFDCFLAENVIICCVFVCITCFLCVLCILMCFLCINANSLEAPQQTCILVSLLIKYTQKVHQCFNTIGSISLFNITGPQYTTYIHYLHQNGSFSNSCFQYRCGNWTPVFLLCIYEKMWMRILNIIYLLRWTTCKTRYAYFYD